ncbi:hypothetical protein GCM10010411_16730 [Actinomadura fulvescens]|uniref:Uncharacterized protein n=1 Tax=Actinomadura fulvescens TaxID=46160 RepID=A0ABN3PGK5_9ACTN
MGTPGLGAVSLAGVAGSAPEWAGPGLEGDLVVTGPAAGLAGTGRAPGLAGRGPGRDRAAPGPVAAAVPGGRALVQGAERAVPALGWAVAGLVAPGPEGAGPVAAKALDSCIPWNVSYPEGAGMTMFGSGMCAAHPEQGRMGS